ncbi:oligopeptide transport system substrate-binding protein [Anaerosphaera aminiphila DSM 21120]|uniref:Oligopeptide transport system substrate-binding protein n=1 Tax=Anaerosphaera aminiphila DSM 21120 TaxID=1120995 RepID=A0A1M5U8K1_9FIRM|nr:peptide ABC transporter substrate-binding protein [Anaerosphaera aminiphila]SHH59238.1 oligopeptide transport system substrate-binding protein [Anaerosphaera aminiphila DSM 21120]
MKKRSLSLLTLVLILALALTGCGGGSKETSSSGNVIRTNNGAEPNSLDPALAKGNNDSKTIYLIFEGLMKYNENGEIVPGMAEKVDISDDGLTYTYTLRDAKWSNGDPVTAGDFEYSWKRVLNPEMGSEYSFQLYYIKGGEEYNTGNGSVDDVGVKAIDDKTLEVSLKSPTPYFDELTAFYTLMPVNKSVVESDPDWAKDVSKGNFVTNGPFKITDWKHGEKIIVAKFEDYYNKDKIKLDGVESDILEEQSTAWQKYQGGEYDYIMDAPQDVVAELIKNKDPEFHSFDKYGTQYLAFNTEKAPFTNQKVRQALSMAIDRQSIIDNVIQGGQSYADGLIPYGSKDDQGKDFREANGKFVTEDIEKANQLLEEGLAELNMTREDMSSLVLSYNTSENIRKMCEAIQEMWRQNLGIEIGLENMDFKVLLERKTAGDFDICRAAWTGDYLDPMTMMDLFMTGEPQNDPKYSNPEYDRLLKVAKSTGDQKVRMDSMKEAEKIMMEDMPLMPLYFSNGYYVAKPYVKGIFTSPLNDPFLIYAEIEK